MFKKILPLLLIFGTVTVLIYSLNIKNTPTPVDTADKFPGKIYVMKDVGEAYMDKFGLTDADFKNISDAGINIIEGNFDICAGDSDIRYILDNAARYGLKVIMPAGSGEAEWGYECDRESYPLAQKPVWQEKNVKSWVKKWMEHPAVYAWDISNEVGSVFPNASILNDSKGIVPEEYYITLEQLRKAYADVKTVDPVHPVLVRMNGWYFFDEIEGKTPDRPEDYFRDGNPFAENVADIVMVNAYSNVEDHYPDFVATVATKALTGIRELDKDAEVWVALGVWEEKPLWYKPTESELEKEISYLKENKDIQGIAYFKYGAKGGDWYLPDSSGSLWNVISSE